MTTRIWGHDIDIDYEYEIGLYDWRRPSWSRGIFSACSPFRGEDDPSFAIDTKHGGWRDQGSKVVGETSGNFVALTAFLRGESYRDACVYLLRSYAPDLLDEAGAAEDAADLPLELRVKRLRMDEPEVTTVDFDYRTFAGPSDYLSGRGIIEIVQRYMQTGYDPATNTLIIPWFNMDGSLGTVKYRAISRKKFWFIKGGRPSGQMVYGLHVIHRKRLDWAAVVEAEIDALTLMSVGIPAIAIGGKAWTFDRVELLQRAGLRRLIAIRDNDDGGREWLRAMVSRLRGKMTIEIALLPPRWKDVNEARQSGYSHYIRKTRRICTVNCYIKL